MTIFSLKINIRIQFFTLTVSEETKTRVYENVKKANSDYFQQQKALHTATNAIVGTVMDEIMQDEYWSQLAIAYFENVSQADTVTITL